MRRKERDLDLVCMGRTSVDLYGEQVGAKLEDTQSFRKYVGGSATNVAVGTARLGVKTAMLTRVGDEQMGRFVRRSLAEDGVDVSHVLPDPERLTPYVLLAVRESEDFPRLFVYENSADMAVAEEDVDPAFIASSGALLVTGTHFSRPVTRAASFEAMRAAKEAGTRIAFDLDYRPVFWGVATHEQGGKMFVESIEVTEVYLSALPDCDLVVGTEGAGDAFMSGFLSGWLREEPTERCLTLGNACGAIVVSRHGCSPAMPTCEELEYYLPRAGKLRRLWDDEWLGHLHRATTRNAPEELRVLAIDHRWQLEDTAEELGAERGRLRDLKVLLGRAFRRVAKTDEACGVLIDDVYGDGALGGLTGSGAWNSRAVEGG